MSSPLLTCFHFASTFDYLQSTFVILALNLPHSPIFSYFLASWRHIFSSHIVWGYVSAYCLLSFQSLLYLVCFLPALFYCILTVALFFSSALHSSWPYLLILVFLHLWCRPLVAFTLLPSSVSFMLTLLFYVFRRILPTVTSGRSLLYCLGILCIVASYSLTLLIIIAVLYVASDACICFTLKFRLAFLCGFPIPAIFFVISISVYFVLPYFICPAVIYCPVVLPCILRSLIACSLSSLPIYLCRLYY